MASTLCLRVSRMEREALPSNPYEDLTDEELDAAILAVKERIEAATGMSADEYSR